MTMNNCVISVSERLTYKLEKLKNAKKIIAFGPNIKAQTPHTKDEFLIFIDGGAHFSQFFHPKQPLLDEHLFLGDGDSLTINSPVSKESFDILLCKEKDLSDLEYFLSLPMDNVEELTLIGFTGGDLDHELSNIGAIFRFLEKNFKNSVTINCDDSMTFKGTNRNSENYATFTRHGGFSLFTLTEQNIVLEGEIDFKGDFTLPPFSSRGLSNISHGSFRINFQKPILLIYHRRKN